jgi:hypothetical protein
LVGNAQRTRGDVGAPRVGREVPHARPRRRHDGALAAESRLAPWEVPRGKWHPATGSRVRVWDVRELGIFDVHDVRLRLIPIMPDLIGKIASGSF